MMMMMMMDKPGARREWKLVDAWRTVNMPPVKGIACALGLTSVDRKPFALLEQLVRWSRRTAGQFFLVNIELAAKVWNKELVRGTWQPLYARDLGLVDQPLKVMFIIRSINWLVT